MKRLIVYDENGRIEAAFWHTAQPIEEISAKYTEMGKRHQLYDGAENIAALYIDMADGETIKVKPPIAVDSEDARTKIKADGVDSITFNVRPAKFTVAVMLNGDRVVHQEDVTDGSFEFSVDHPGTYQINLSAEHPYAPGYLVIEAE